MINRAEAKQIYIYLCNSSFILHAYLQPVIIAIKWTETLVPCIFSANNSANIYCFKSKCLGLSHIMALPFFFNRGDTRFFLLVQCVCIAGNYLLSFNYVILLWYRKKKACLSQSRVGLVVSQTYTHLLDVSAEGTKNLFILYEKTISGL